MERRYGSLHRQTGRQGNGSFFALTHAWLNLHFFSLSLSLFSLAGWSMMLHNFSSIAQRERERTLCPISSVVLTSNERRKGAISTFWLIFIFCRFISSSSSFPQFYATTLDFCCIKRRPDRLLRPWRHLPAQQQHLSCLLLPCISVVVVSSSVPAASLHPIGCVNKDWQGTQQTTSCKYPRHTHTRERENLGFLETLKPISLRERGQKGVE